jgi:hypothetical protein
MVITARPITVTADAQTKVYGYADPSLTYKVTGTLVTGDSFSGGLSRASGENVGTYAIGQGSLVLSANYKLSYVGANLVITARPVTAAVTAGDKTYNGNATAAITSCTVSPKAGADDVACSPTAATFASANASASAQTVTATGIALTGTTAGNYVLTGTTAMTAAKINPAPTTTSLNSSKNPSSYGDLITLTATVTNSATSPSPTGSLVLTIDGTAVSATTSASGNTLTKTYSIATLVAASHSVKATYTNNDGNFGGSGPASLSQTVLQAATVSTLTVTPKTQQYSDLVTLTATLTPDNINYSSPATSVTFYVGTQTMGTAQLVDNSGVLTGTLQNVALLEPTPFGTAPTGQMKPGNAGVVATFNNVNPNFSVINPTASLTITQEDARVAFAGNLFYGIPSTVSTGTITLVATISDITALCDPNNVPTGFIDCPAWAAAQTPTVPWDPNAGDIRNATVTFVDRSNNATLCSAPVLLINSSDTKTGSVTCQFTGIVGNTGSTQYTVGIVVSGYYSRNMSTDNAVVTISQVGPGMITGGGYLVMKNSAGTISGDPGTHNNFGFNVQYKSSGQNPHGNINSIVRRIEKDGIQHVYQIKGNSMSALAVYQMVNGTWTAGCTGATSTSPCKAQFNGNANIQDITNPLSPVSVTGNNSLQFNMTDYGTPGSSDTLGITLWNSFGGIWFSTNWVGTPPATVEQLLGGGNLVVH